MDIYHRLLLYFLVSAVHFSHPIYLNLLPNANRSTSQTMITGHYTVRMCRPVLYV
jgi:hypothetical protein